tara:strand:- start:1028 stop:1663 length:636 start_codon:yes stop_codon:yes gene_type:complete
MKTYCVSLPESDDRKEHMSSEILKLVDSFEYIYADPPHKDFRTTNYAFPRELGCTLSHLKGIIHGSRYNENILMLEDDIFINDNASNILEESMNELPEDWGLLYLSGRPKDQTYHFSKNLIKTNTFLSTISYLINKNYVYSYIDHVLNNLTNPFPNSCADNVLNGFFINNSYCIYPKIVNPMSGYSVLRFGNRDYENDWDLDWKQFSPKKT